ncbi:MAG: hypothetical protein GX131_05145, partial [candidate division WS1 bacterium]|nr:hypothetical protein [candidate division WS1 bacterium]
MRTGRQSITLLTCALIIPALLALSTVVNVRAQEAQEPPPSPAVEAAEPAPPSAPAAQPGPPATTVPTEPGGEPEPGDVEVPPRAAPSPRPPDRQPETPAPREPAAAEPRDETEIPALAEVMPEETADPAGAEESGAPPEGSTTTVDEASRATSRRIAHERRTEAIQQSLELLATAPEELSPHQKAAMIGQISQGALVELSALREEMVQARLDLQRLESYLSQIIADRHQVPRMVRTGQIPALGASARWDELQERSLELQEAIDSAFEERLRLLEDIPRAESDLEQVRELRDALSATLDPELREVLSDAQEYLQQRLEASQELLALQNRQAAAATEAYDEISHYLEELGAAIITARQRGLLARSPDHVSPETFINLADDLARLPELPKQIVAGYYESGRPPINMTAWALRLVATIAMLAALVATWLRLPGWLLSVFCADTSHRESAWGEREVQLLVPVARAVLVAAVTSASLLIWGVHGEWTAAAMLVVGTWAMYFGLMTTLRQLLAPRYEQYRIVPVSTETARLIFRLARGLALWSAAILPIIWGLSALEYRHQDVLVLLSVIHVCGLAVIAAAMIYRAGGPQALVAGGETTGTRTWRRALAATAPA